LNQDSLPTSFGMQMAVIEAARNLCGIAAANSTEFGPTDESLTRGSRVSDVYGGATEISERHRHRYSGLSPDGVLPEIVEYEDHPWFIGVQFHPELKSRPFEPHPLFASFIHAAMVQSRLV
jgi:CTP synthase